MPGGRRLPPPPAPPTLLPSRPRPPPARRHRSPPPPGHPPARAPPPGPARRGPLASAQRGPAPQASVPQGGGQRGGGRFAAAPLLTAASGRAAAAPPHGAARFSPSASRRAPPLQPPPPPPGLTGRLRRFRLPHAASGGGGGLRGGQRAEGRVRPLPAIAAGAGGRLASAFPATVTRGRRCRGHPPRTVCVSSPPPPRVGKRPGFPRGVTGSWALGVPSPPEIPVSLINPSVFLFRREQRAPWRLRGGGNFHRQLLLLSLFFNITY